MELADNALITLEMAKTVLGIPADDHDSDELIIILINGLSERVERYLGYSLKQSDYTESYVPSGRQKQLVLHKPITAVYDVKFNGSTIPADKYLWDDVNLARYGIIWKDDMWPYRDYLMGISYEPIARSRNLVIAYQAGYVLPKDATDDNPSTLPNDIILMLLELLSSMITTQFGDAAGLSAYSISDVSWTFDRSQNTTFFKGLRAFR